MKTKNKKTVKIRMTLSIGIANCKQEDTVEYDEADIPADLEEREKWLNDEWQAWAWNFIDGGATIEAS